MRLYRKTALGVVVSMVVLCSAAVSNANAECLSWDSARHVIKKNGLVSAGEIRRQLKGRSGQLQQIRLCVVGGRYIYKVVTIRPGKVNKHIVDARSGRYMRRGGSRLKGDGPVAAGVGRVPKLPKIPRFFRGRKRNGY